MPSTTRICSLFSPMSFLFTVDSIVGTYEIKCKSKYSVYPILKLLTTPRAFNPLDNPIIAKRIFNIAGKHFKLFSLCQWRWYLSFMCCSRATKPPYWNRRRFIPFWRLKHTLPNGSHNCLVPCSNISFEWFLFRHTFAGKYIELSLSIFWWHRNKADNRKCLSSKLQRK